MVSEINFYLLNYIHDLTPCKNTKPNIAIGAPIINTVAIIQVTNILV